MTLIEGIGDEVTQFFGILLLLVLGLVAWWSTRISDLPIYPIRTVLIFERRSQNDVNTSRSTVTVTSQPERTDGNERGCGRRLDLSETDKDSVTAPETVQDDVAPNGPEESSSEGESGASTGRDESGASTGRDESGTSTGRVDTEPKPEEAADESEASGGAQDLDNIRIRLKYLNDDQKLVRGKLHELLGDFKRRNFSVELSGEKRVRLIFNGQVLQSDEQTLQSCGLYDNCVVHCLVHQQVTQNRQQSPQQAAQPNASPPEWNLGGLLYVSLSILLGLTWFLRYHYAQLFTLTTTTALTGLTAMFAVSIIGMYMPDQEAPAA